MSFFSVVPTPSNQEQEKIKHVKKDKNDSFYFTHPSGVPSGVPMPSHFKTNVSDKSRQHSIGLWKRLGEAITPKDIYTALTQLEKAGLVKSEHIDNLIRIVRDAREHFGEEEWKTIWSAECKEAFRSLLPSFE